jgi:uncharacterized small protein (DUF1192 family)
VAKTEELKSKDGGIETLETVVGEMSQNIATLQSEIASLQVYVTIDNILLSLFLP